MKFNIEKIISDMTEQNGGPENLKEYIENIFDKTPETFDRYYPKPWITLDDTVKRVRMAFLLGAVR